MINSLKITVLCENTVYKRGLLAEHGLSYWIEADGHRILFDTGQGLTLEHNARVLEIDLSSAHSLVLSHGHYDHTGGLANTLDRFAKTDLYVHPDAFGKRWSRNGKVGMDATTPPITNVSELQPKFAAIKFTTLPTTIIDGVCVTGAVPRRSKFEDEGKLFFLNEALTRPDPLHDDQAMFIKTPKGIVVILGCAHAGVVNTCDYICELAGHKRIHAIFGGMHLAKASDKRISLTLSAIESYGVQILGAGHCTGSNALRKMWKKCGRHCVEFSVSQQYTF